MDSLFKIFSLGGEGRAQAVGSIMNNIVPMSSLRNEFGRIINPYMRELNADIFESIRNRNLASEYLATDPLPFKYDMLTGKPLTTGTSYNVHGTQLLLSKLTSTTTVLAVAFCLKATTQSVSRLQR